MKSARSRIHWRFFPFVAGAIAAILAYGGWEFAARSAETDQPDSTAAEISPSVKTTIGMEGIYYARYRGPLLEAAPFDEESFISLRIADVTEVPDSGSNPVAIYELRYIGTEEGVHDLRDYLVRRDGEPIEGLEPILVEVVELLPPDYQGVLALHDREDLPTAWPYTLILQLLALAWLVPITWVVIEYFKRRRPLIQPAAHELTLADQLRPLIEAALAGQMSRSEKARLEMLLIGYWRDRLELDGLLMHDALARMREDREAGALLRDLEAWLHQPPGRAEVDVAALVAPYAHVEADRELELPAAARPQTAEVTT